MIASATRGVSASQPAGLQAVLQSSIASKTEVVIGVRLHAPAYLKRERRRRHFTQRCDVLTPASSERSEMPPSSRRTVARDLTCPSSSAHRECGRYVRSGHSWRESTTRLRGTKKQDSAQAPQARQKNRAGARCAEVSARWAKQRANPSVDVAAEGRQRSRLDDSEAGRRRSASARGRSAAIWRRSRRPAFPSTTMPATGRSSGVSRASRSGRWRGAA